MHGFGYLGRCQAPRKRRPPGALLVAVILLAACGNDQSRPRPTPTPALPATASPSPSPAVQATPIRPPVTPPTMGPSATMTPTYTPRPTKTATATSSATPTFVPVALAIGSVGGEPGGSAVFPVTLVAGGEVAGTQNDIAFPEKAPIAAGSDGLPDCTVDASINKPATTFNFQPAACVPGIDCTAVRAIVLAFDNVDPIPIGSLLFSCRVDIAADAPTGAAPLRCSRADASDPHGNLLPTTCTNGVIVINRSPIPTPTPTATPRRGAGRWLVDDLGRVGGADVTSAPNAPLLTLRAQSGATRVSVEIAPMECGASAPLCGRAA